MSRRYELNMEIFEVCTTLMNCARWKGNLEIGAELKKHKERVDPDIFEFLEYGINLICLGTMPEIRSFLLNEEIYLYSVSDDTRRDMRLVSMFLKWIQECDFESHFTLIQAFDEVDLNSKVQNWSRMNEYDLSITMMQAERMTNEEWLALRDMNPTVRDYYDKQFEDLKKSSGMI